MSAFRSILHPIQSVKEHFRNAADATGLQDYLRQNHVNARWVAIDKDGVYVHFGSVGRDLKKTPYYQIAVPRDETNPVGLNVGHYTPLWFTGSIWMRGTKVSEQELYGSADELPASYRPAILAIQNGMKNFNLVYAR